MPLEAASSAGFSAKLTASEKGNGEGLAGVPGGGGGRTDLPRTPAVLPALGDRVRDDVDGDTNGFETKEPSRTQG